MTEGIIDYTSEVKKEITPLPGEHPRHYRDRVFKWNLLVNVVHTKHYDDDSTGSVGENLIRHAGVGAYTFKKWAQSNDLISFGDDYSTLKFGGRGVTQKAHFSDEAKQFAYKITRRAYGKRTIRRVKNSRKGIQQVSDKYIVRHEQVKVNLDKLRELRNHYLDKGHQQRVKDCDIYLDLAADGYMYEQYYQCRTGRYTAIGYSLQNAPKQIRKALLSGYYEYDINTSQPAILSQLFDNTPWTDYYVNNKKAMRRQVANELGINPDNAKVLLQGVLFGGSLDYNYQGQLYQYINKDINLNQGTLKKFKKEIVEAANQLPEVWYSHKSSKSEQLCYMLQDIEKRVLEVVMNQHPIQALLHDGFVSSQRLDTNQLTELVYAETNFYLTFSEKRL